jgi:hypothetical protein
MSNVLIGIIGVILFIGLALSGAMFLGERFADSRNSSVGAATVQAVTQVASAISYSNTENDVKVNAGYNLDGLRTAQYLKSVPANPAGPDGIVVLGRNGESTGVAGGLVVAHLPVGQDRLCGAIAKQTAGASDIVGIYGFVTAASATDLPRGPAGCFKVGPTAISGLAADQLYAYARL